MKFTLSFEIENSEFFAEFQRDGNPFPVRDYEAIAAVLARVATSGDICDDFGVVRDLNGNRIGEFCILE